MGEVLRLEEIGVPGENLRAWSMQSEQHSSHVTKVTLIRQQHGAEIEAQSQRKGTRWIKLSNQHPT